MVDSADGRTVVHSEHVRRSRKERACGECRRAIHEGDQYEYATFLWGEDWLGGDAEWFVEITCLGCCHARRWLLDHCGGFCYQSVIEDLAEHAWDQAGDIDLMRRIVGARRKWRMKRAKGEGRLWARVSKDFLDHVDHQKEREKRRLEPPVQLELFQG